MLDSWHVVSRYCARLLLAAGAVVYSTLAPALGLGEITLHSALNQPLRADIALVDAAGLEEGDLSVNLATADEFSQAGIERVFFLNDLKFTPILRGNRSLIRVSSNKAVNEPFLNFLVQLNQPNGRVLREYTVLIDPPGAPGVVPVADEPVANRPNSAFPSVTPAVAPAPAPAAKKTAAPKVEQPIAAPAVDLAAEQLAASVLQNQQLQKTIDELNARLQAQDEQIAGQKKQVTELETRLAEVKQTPPNPPPPVAVTPAAVTVDETDTFNWPLLVALTAVIALLLGLFVYRRRQQAQALPVDSPAMSSVHEPVLDPDDELLAKSAVEKSASVHHDETPAGDVLEGVGIYLAYGRFTEAAGLLRDALAKEPERTDLALQLLDVLGKQGDVAAYDDQENSLREAGLGALELQDIRGRYPKLERPAPIAAAPLAAAAIVSPALKTDSEPDDDFQLNLSELSMDSSWDLVSPFDSNEPSKQQPDAEAPAFTSSLYVMPDGFEIPEEPSLDEPELEWVAEPDAQTLDDDFLAEFGDIGTSLELEPLSLEPVGATSAGKLEQAQNCIDDGDLDSAIELLNELLKEADEPLKQTARTLLAGIR